MRIKPVHIFLLIFMAVSCLEPYYPDVKEYTDLPVITGSISDEPGPYFVNLTHSAAILDMEIKPIRRALVTISDDLGTEEVLMEVKPGIYSTKIDGIQGIQGRSYRLTVETEGRIYQSDYELLRPAVAIDSIYSEIGQESISTGYTDGLQFYVNTGNISDPNTNLLWTLKETYKFRSEFELDYIYYSVDSIITNYSDSGLICWRTEWTDLTYTWAASSLSETRLSNFPLHFINNLNNKLTERYSVEVYQYTISDNAYNYWSEIRKLHDETGSLYTRQPYQVKGNLKNAENPDALVLGYFMAAGVSKKRIFVNPPPFIFNYKTCSMVINLLELYNPADIRFPVYAMQLGGDRGFADLSCFDCRLKGGTIIEPDFWEEFDMK